MKKGYVATKKESWIMRHKQQGEWAELCFMARAKRLGLGVLKPFGESGQYDVAVENGGPILRVQVKSTAYVYRGNTYTTSLEGPGGKKYKKGTVDFFAVYVIPIDEWYIIPFAAMGKRWSVHITPGSKRAKWLQYREAWDLLRRLEIQACVEPVMLAEAGTVGGSEFRQAALSIQACAPCKISEDILLTDI